MEKWLIPGVGERKYKMSLEYLIVPESKKLLKKWWGKCQPINVDGIKEKLEKISTLYNIFRMCCNILLRSFLLHWLDTLLDGPYFWQYVSIVVPSFWHVLPPLLSLSWIRNSSMSLSHPTEHPGSPPLLSLSFKWCSDVAIFLLASWLPVCTWCFGTTLPSNIPSHFPTHNFERGACYLFSFILHLLPLHCLTSLLPQNHIVFKITGLGVSLTPVQMLVLPPARCMASDIYFSSPRFSHQNNGKLFLTEL